MSDDRLDLLPGLLDQAGFRDRTCAAHPAQVSQELVRYQMWHGLDATGLLDVPTWHSLNAPRICRLPDRPLMLGVAPHWPTQNITYSVSDDVQFAGMSQADALACLEWAWDRWRAICGLRVTWTANRAAAHVLVHSGAIDGAWGNIAFSEFPDGSGLQIHVRFDAQEKWVTNRPPSRFRIDLGQCATHEFGHAIGIQHIAGQCMMAPIYDRSIVDLTDLDVQAARSLYPPGI